MQCSNILHFFSTTFFSSSVIGDVSTCLFINDSYGIATNDLSSIDFFIANAVSCGPCPLRVAHRFARRSIQRPTLSITKPSVRPGPTRLGAVAFVETDDYDWETMLMESESGMYGGG